MTPDEISALLSILEREFTKLEANPPAGISSSQINMMCDHIGYTRMRWSEALEKADKN